MISDPVQTDNEFKDAPCCGGSLALFNASNGEKDKITRAALSNYLEKDPEILVTACPLCKKTFAKHSPIDVLDIAELVMEAIPKASPILSYE
jgi:heterodisulfide reductase subunit B